MMVLTALSLCYQHMDMDPDTDSPDFEMLGSGYCREMPSTQIQKNNFIINKITLLNNRVTFIINKITLNLTWFIT